VTVSTDGTTWSKPVAIGKGTGARTEIVLTPTRAKFVRVTQTDSLTETPVPNWSITNLRVYEAPATAPAR
jgi:glucosylceramidase